MQGLNRRLYVLLTHTIKHVYLPRDYYFSRGGGVLLDSLDYDSDGKSAIEFHPENRLNLLKRPGMVRAEWPSSSYLETLNSEAVKGLHCVEVKSSYNFILTLSNGS